jgi:hypothetical protein
MAVKIIMVKPKANATNTISAAVVAETMPPPYPTNLTKATLLV